MQIKGSSKEKNELFMEKKITLSNRMGLGLGLKSLSVIFNYLRYLGEFGPPT